ncbi:late embryogenesis abundant protein Lea5-like [Abrus precatorius]|uniref:Late embryogenesis abundant protein Lea5-like n=1 Tax=Abrus precatorius TaxID=3816 RepID=A0A8B8JNN8_ABRPR|nr:late embryogenesis abundant protein Lea5-like [Abrus precatorius]
MAHSLSQAKRVGLLVAQSISPISLHRRGYAAASDVSLRVGLGNIARRSGMEEKPVARDRSEAYSAWAPDPVTGFYRPINHTPEIDPVELRQMLLKHPPRAQRSL